MNEHQPDDGKVVQLHKHGIPGSELAVRDDDEVEEADYLEGRIVDPEDEDYLPHPVIEHGGYIAAGAIVLARRAWESRSTVVYDRGIGAAQSTGDHGAALEWVKEKRQWQIDRHARRFDWIELPARILGHALQALAAAVGVLLFIGIALAWHHKDVFKLGAPFLFVLDAVAVTVTFFAMAWLWLLLAAVTVAGCALWRIGLHAAENGDIDWLSTSTDPDFDIEIDETTIAQALGALRIPQINDHLKQGLPLQFITTARRDGRGTHAVVRLPAGVPAERIARRRADLATGLYRLAKEVWPKTGSEAGIMDLWVADKGALEQGAGPYPLLNEGVVDVFRGVPFGRTLRGDPMVAPVMERNTICGGMPGQGKSSAARIIMAGAMLDPTAELRIWVPDTNFDFEVFRPRCSRYVMGAEDEHIEQILNDLRELYAEVQSRGDVLVQHEEPQVSRKLADLDVGMHPLFGLLEEAHLAITHKQHGEEISQLLVDIVRLGRKRGIHMIVSTQAPTKDSMPRDVTRNCSNGIAFAVGDHVANDALLGQGAYRGGHRATELIPGVDAGTAVVKGFSGERSDMVQAYFLSVKRGNDQVTPLVQRSLAEIKRRGRAIPGTGRPRAAIEARDLLDDLSEALQDSEDRVKLTDVVSLLRKVAPGWQPYKQLSGKGLHSQLTTLQIRVYTTANVPSVDPADVRAAVMRASTTDLDTE